MDSNDKNQLDSSENDASLEAEISDSQEDMEYRATAGPLPKSFYTVQLEEVVRKLLRNEYANFFRDPNTGDNLISFGNKKYNWTKIATHANYEHLELKQSDFELYKNNVAIQQEGNSNLEPNLEEQYRSELYKHYDDKDSIPEPPISFQEMQAINVYSGGSYLSINKIMRDQYNFQHTLPEDIKFGIIQSAMCASGLQKIPFVTIQEVYRGDDNFVKLLSKEQENLKEKPIITVLGFMSSMARPKDATTPLPTMFTRHDVRIKFTSSIKGAYIEPIAYNKGEHEFLVPPTQVEIESLSRIGRVIEIEAKCVSDLNSVTSESLKCTEGAWDKDNVSYLLPAVDEQQIHAFLEQQADNGVQFVVLDKHGKPTHYSDGVQGLIDISDRALSFDEAEELMLTPPSSPIVTM